MNRKMIIGILGITVILLSACGAKNETAADDLADMASDAEEIAEIASSSEMEEIVKPEETAPTGDYREIYEWIVEKDEGDSLLFSQSYLDEDDIPELVVWNYDDDTYSVFTVKDGKSFCLIDSMAATELDYYEYSGIVASFASWNGGGDEGGYGWSYYQISGDRTLTSDDEPTLSFSYDAVNDEEGNWTGEGVTQYYHLGQEIDEATYRQMADELGIVEENRKDLRRNSYYKPEILVLLKEYEDWKAAYLSYLDAYEYADRCTYSLIYVDEDEIPELMIDTGYEAGGCFILTYHDGVLDGWQSDRLNVTYIEKGNLICNSDGNMGYYYDRVYTIQDGKWRYVEGGKYGDGPDGVQFDENGDYIGVYVYIWNGEAENAGYWDGDEISEEEYKARLNSVYPTEQKMHPERYYILKEICSVLRTGDVSSAGHRYELVVEDLTWTEADTLCREKGGYLAAITSWEELERIQEQMIAENKTGITFFVGAKNPMERNMGGTWGYHWFEPESGAKYDMLDLYDALFGFWLDDEPSYTGLTEDGEEVVEDCVVLLYLKEDERCYINDVPDDILSAAPSYSGKIGYICEYDE